MCENWRVQLQVMHTNHLKKKGQWSVWRRDHQTCGSTRERGQALVSIIIIDTIWQD